MLQIFVFFGAGAITLLLSEALSGKKAKDGCRTLAEWFAFSILDQFAALVILIPANKAAIFTAKNGLQTVQFWILGYGVFLAAAVVMGIVFAMVKKKLRIEIQVEPEKSVTDEEENDI